LDDLSPCNLHANFKDLRFVVIESICIWHRLLEFDDDYVLSP